MIQLTRNFTFEEFIYSSTAKKNNIDNRPGTKELENILRLAEILQKIRDRYKKPISISSGFRCKELNSLVGGAKNSDHLFGAAVDLKCENNKELFDLIHEMTDNEEIELRQIIWEYGDSRCPAWVHIGINSDFNKYKKNEVLYII